MEPPYDKRVLSCVELDAVFVSVADVEGYPDSPYKDVVMSIDGREVSTSMKIDDPSAVDVGEAHKVLYEEGTWEDDAFGHQSPPITTDYSFYSLSK